jgi:hypothetical protein
MVREPEGMQTELFASSRPTADNKSRGRSRVSNGHALLPRVDGRSAWVCRTKDPHISLSDDTFFGVSGRFLE